MLGARIQRARKAAGLSLRDLGQQIALSHAAIKKYEDNEVTPSSDILIKLAHALHVKVEYFFRPRPFISEKKISYREHANIPRRHLDEITFKILDQVEQRVELENLFPTPPTQTFSINLPKKITTIEKTEHLADEIRSQWNLGLDPIPDLIDLFEEHGIKVFEIDNLNYPKFNGLSTYVNQIPVIVVGKSWPGDRQRFTLAHELGHLILNDRIKDNTDIENYCNRFAGSFLLPQQSLISILGKHRTSIEPLELSLLKQAFGISMTCILHRAEETGIISSSLYRQLRADFDKHGWSKKEPGKLYPREKTSIFAQMVFHALAEEYIGESKAAEFMNMSLESFRALRTMENSDVSYHQ